MNILFSTSYSMTLNVPHEDVDGHKVSVAVRSPDWGKKGIAKYFHHVAEAIRVARCARHFDALVLCTVGIEAFFIAKWRHLLCPRTIVVCFDLLMPRESHLMRLTRSWLKNIDAILCIRRGDISTLERRFGIQPGKCDFVYFPIDPEIAKVPVTEEDYIYSAGWAYRDWKTLIGALSGQPYRAIISAGDSPSMPSGYRAHIEVLPLLSPEGGRKVMANARLVVLAFEDTDLPCGPLILLEAMAMGKPVVATNINGTRDYVRDEETAILVPPWDSQAMATAIRRLMEDGETRRNMGSAAREDVFRRFAMKNFSDKTVNICARVAEQKKASAYRL